MDGGYCNWHFSFSVGVHLVDVAPDGLSANRKIQALPEAGGDFKVFYYKITRKEWSTQILINDKTRLLQNIKYI